MKHGTTRRWLWRFFVGTATAVVLASVLVVYLMQRPPAVWREAQAALSQMSEQRREELAQGVMHRIQSAMNRLGPETLNGSGYAHDNSKPTALETSLAELPVDETFEVELSSEELLAIASDWADQWIAQRGYDVP